MTMHETLHNWVEAQYRDINRDVPKPRWDAAAIVKKYIELRDFCDAEKKAFAARMKPYTEGMEMLEAAAHALMQETKQDALSTEFGTAFKVSKTSVTCTDKETFHAWVRKINGWGFLTAHVTKEAVEDWMELHEGQIPPGLKVDGYIAVQFRRA
jgi:putative heme iron utilization protein